MGERDSFSNKILRFFFIVFLMLSFGAIIYYVIANPPKLFEEEKEETREITPLMYEVTKKGSDNKIYLFGSMHKVKLGEFDFPEYVTGAYEQSDYLACEADVVKYEESASLATKLKSVVYSDGSKLKDHLSENAYTDVKDYLIKNKIYEEAYEYYNAQAIVSLIQKKIIINAGLTGDGVDEYFIKKAKKDKKNILEVESVEMQKELLNSFPDKLYEIELVVSILIDEDKQIEEYKKTYSNWKKGMTIENEDVVDIDSINDDGEEFIEKYNIDLEETKKMFEDYNKKTLDDRNEYMADKLIEYFEGNKKVFFMVGAAHLPGNKGIATILARKGYTVKIVK